MSTQSNTSGDLQTEIASLNMGPIDIDMEAHQILSTRNQASQTPPVATITLQSVDETGLYYSHMAPLVPLELDDIQSKYVSPSIYTKNGFIIQFINNNANCSPTVIGGARTNESDVRLIPSYLAKNEASIKTLAVRTLVNHLQQTQCGTAALETLGDDDYGISFSVASLSRKGMNLNPSRRHEGPLFYCHLQGLVEPCLIQQSKMEMETAYVINCYIHILAANQRRNSLIAKAKEARIEANAAALKATATPPPVAPANSPPSNHSGKAARTRSQSRSGPYTRNSNPHYNQQGDSSYNQLRSPRYDQQGNNQYNQQSNLQRNQQGNSIQQPRFANQPPRKTPQRMTVGNAIDYATHKKDKTTQASLASNPPLPITKAPTWISGKGDDLPNHV